MELLGERTNEKHYKRAVKACCLAIPNRCGSTPSFAAYLLRKMVI